MNIEINVIGDSESWWLDTIATRHVYHDLSLFKNSNETKDRKILLGDHYTTTKVFGICKVELKFTYGKTSLTKKVLHTLNIRNNLVSDYLLNKASFTHSIGVDLSTLTKNNVFLGKGSATNGTFN